MKGYIHIYTGDGKGKTTAALGVVTRAAGAGLKVYIAQFLKKGSSSELLALTDRFSDVVTVEQFGTGKFVKDKPAPEDIKAAQDGLQQLRHALDSDKYDLVIADEINNAVAIGVIEAQSVLELIRTKPDRVELILTGRNAPQQLIAAADLVTEMRNTKHYFDRGIKARKGIEY